MPAQPPASLSIRKPGRNIVRVTLRYADRDVYLNRIKKSVYRNSTRDIERGWGGLDEEQHDSTNMSLLYFRGRIWAVMFPSRVL